MKTSALLPTPGDPFLVRHWLINFERIWAGEVDELLVQVNRQEDDESRAYIRERVSAVGGIYTEDEAHGSHGRALDRLVRETDADVVVLMEDDARVRVRGAVRRHIAMVVDGEADVVGSHRGSMSGQLDSECRRRWGGEGGMWPCFVFARRSCLLATEGTFGARGWQPGETVPGLGIVATEESAADTFGATAMQLRDRFRVLDVPQWKGPWDWGWWLYLGDEMLWFHAGSLSSSNNLASTGEQIFAQGRPVADVEEEGEWAHRLHWWRRCLRLYGHELPAVAERYAARLERLRLTVGVPIAAIDAWDDVVGRMITWDERA